MEGVQQRRGKRLFCGERTREKFLIPGYYSKFLAFAEKNCEVAGLQVRGRVRKAYALLGPESEGWGNRMSMADSRIQVPQYPNNRHP
jgi:hypothetical protein